MEEGKRRGEKEGRVEGREEKHALKAYGIH